MEYLKMDIPQLKVCVNKLFIEEICDIVHKAAHEDRQCLIANHNMHSVYLYHTNDKMRAFYELSDYTFIDGMPLVWLAKHNGYKLTADNRTTCLDLIPGIISLAENEGLRVFYLGGKHGVAKKGAAILRVKYPKLQIDTHHGYFGVRPGNEGNTHVIEKINEYRPNILLVGMGMPAQEHWIVDNYKALRANVIITVGAYIDYVAGQIPTPPRWIGHMGMESLYRLCCEPGRLWRRYLVEPWLLFRLLGFHVERRRRDRKD
ncbi:MAG: WecB/TagA/CpsF family glycosyltransferase [Candidatus Magnetominusculus sp. LBB02]|nr:WecB/TagA/CpsF family glycosyltransferase [Candidatus Magnetominusculus sp. LBB02]